MTSGGLLMSVPMLGLLVWAAAVDVRQRRIPNWLTFSLILSGLAQSFTWARTVSPSDACLGFLTGFALTFVMFAIGAMGGGDVKLLAGIGAWLGPWPTLTVFATEAIIGMVFVLAHAAVTGRLAKLLRNSTIIAMNFAAAGEAGAGSLEQAVETGKACSSDGRHLPYAVPVLLAVLLFYFSL
jgi:prepilin peptidase CpaA